MFIQVFSDYVSLDIVNFLISNSHYEKINLRLILNLEIEKKDERLEEMFSNFLTKQIRNIRNELCVPTNISWNLIRTFYNEHTEICYEKNFLVIDANDSFKCYYVNDKNVLVPIYFSIYMYTYFSSSPYIDSESYWYDSIVESIEKFYRKKIFPDLLKKISRDTSFLYVFKLGKFLKQPTQKLIFNKKNTILHNVSNFEPRFVFEPKIIIKTFDTIDWFKNEGLLINMFRFGSRDIIHSKEIFNFFINIDCIEKILRLIRIVIYNENDCGLPIIIYLVKCLTLILESQKYLNNTSTFKDTFMLILK